MLFKTPRINNVVSTALFLLCGLPVLSQEEPDTLFKKQSTPRTEYSLPEASASDDKQLARSSSGAIGRKADKFYDDRAYQAAIPYYEKL